MYIHGFVDGVLAAVVLGMAALIVAAVIYSRKKEIKTDGGGRRYMLPISCADALPPKLGTTGTPKWAIMAGEKEKDLRGVADGEEYDRRMGRGRQTSIAGGVGAGWFDG